MGPDAKKHKWDVFLAHAGSDLSEAEKLYSILESKCKVFLDSKCILPGDTWDEEIQQAQNQSKITVVLVSKNTDRAYYQKEEIASAIAMAREKSHRVVPVFLDYPSGLINIPYGLRLKHAIIAADYANFQAIATTLLWLLKKLEDQNITNNLEEAKSTVLKEQPGIRFVFNNSFYPKINFSIGNNSDDAQQISSLKVKVLAMEDYDDSSVVGYCKPRIILNYSLTPQSPHTKTVFGEDAVWDLEPKELAPFQLNINCQYGMALLSLEAELITINSPFPIISESDHLILVKAHIDHDGSEGILWTLSKDKIFSFLKGEIKDEPFRLPQLKAKRSSEETSLIEKDYFEKVVQELIAKAAGEIWRTNLKEGWKLWIQECKRLDVFALGIKSFVDATTETSISLEGFDITIGISNSYNIQYCREHILKRVCNNLGSVEYLMNVLIALPEHWYIINKIMIKLFESDRSKVKIPSKIINEANNLGNGPNRLEYGFNDAKELRKKEKVINLWRNWWANNIGNNYYSGLNWKQSSPHLLENLSKLQASNK